MTSDTHLAAVFEDERARLVALAHRMLGSRADAEDVVQEVWLRLVRHDPASIGNLPGWLTTVAARVCLDMLRARKHRPLPADEPDLPEFTVSEDVESPDDAAAANEAVGLALLVVLGALGPDERLAFVLHDIFAVPFKDIAEILGTSATAAKMMASRARRKVRGADRPNEGRQRQRQVVDAFLAAARNGDFEALLRVLDPQITWRSYTPGGVVVKIGATEVIAAAERGAHASVVARRVLVNGEPGIMTWSRTGAPLSVMACSVRGGRIVEVVALVDPRRLASMPTPPWRPAGTDD
ncbi:RNA polymerase sigma-70 factor, ECF subfamily [Micromonospora echinaurantiaca]|uniref:RNA polymerase sigma-70 factor, ECF subfamily n=1 Tax=Micromonospora echinaurantiaca TaxID=47857 RepID=A0A1C5I2K2_9ACTN|nr:sigma-70 family RNA polymerase sigma factor [Micromonospora echinaurantiaca]SCG52121.1 RNA polymerase sigma-70 factor, ECF subfamily [Micromonospora echinaurantiaca]